MIWIPTQIVYPNVHPEAPSSPPPNEFGGIVEGGRVPGASADGGGVGGRVFFDK